MDFKIKDKITITRSNLERNLVFYVSSLYI